MTKGEFTSLQLQYHQNGKSLKQFLSDTGICYSNYHYRDSAVHLIKRDTFVWQSSRVNLPDFTCEVCQLLCRKWQSSLVA